MRSSAFCCSNAVRVGGGMSVSEVTLAAESLKLAVSSMRGLGFASCEFVCISVVVFVTSWHSVICSSLLLTAVGLELVDSCLLPMVGLVLAEVDSSPLLAVRLELAVFDPSLLLLPFAEQGVLQATGIVQEFQLGSTLCVLLPSSALSATTGSSSVGGLPSTTTPVSILVTGGTVEDSFSVFVPLQSQRSAPCVALESLLTSDTCCGPTLVEGAGVSDARLFSG